MKAQTKQAGLRIYQTSPASIKFETKFSGVRQAYAVVERMGDALKPK